MRCTVDDRIRSSGWTWLSSVDDFLAGRGKTFVALVADDERELEAGARVLIQEVCFRIRTTSEYFKSCAARLAGATLGQVSGALHLQQDGMVEHGSHS